MGEGEGEVRVRPDGEVLAPGLPDGDIEVEGVMVDIGLLVGEGEADSIVEEDPEEALAEGEAFVDLPLLLVPVRLPSSLPHPLL